MPVWEDVWCRKEFSVTSEGGEVSRSMRQVVGGMD